MSAQVTEVHRELARRIMFEFTQAGTATASDVRMAAQLIADSEARACAELRGALALGQQNCDDVFEDLRNERDQLRAEVEQANEHKDDWMAKHYGMQSQCAKFQARAERAEAELAAERARLDWLESKCPILWSLADHATGPYWLLTDFPGYTEETASQHKTARAAIDAAMKEGK